MLEFCAMIPVEPRAFWVSVGTQKHPQKAKKRRISWIVIGPSKQEKREDFTHATKILVTSKHLFIGDATFLYIERRKSSEYERAVEAARSESRMCGSYRTDDKQVAACVRLGDKEQSLKVKPVDVNLLEIEVGPADFQA
jgi:hypothetical protein